MELRYLCDADRREVDFVVTSKGNPLFAVECKVSARNVDPSLQYFATRTSIPRFYVTHLGEAHYERGPVTVVPFARLCQDLRVAVSGVGAGVGGALSLGITRVESAPATRLPGKSSHWPSS